MICFNQRQVDYLKAVISGLEKNLEKKWEVPPKAREVAILNAMRKVVEGLPKEKRMSLWERVSGYKTVAGAVAVAFIVGARATGLISPEVADVLVTVAASIFGVGVAHKFYKAGKRSCG